MGSWRGRIGFALGLVVAAHAHDGRPSSSLSREYSLRVWRVSDGLPQNRIQAISQTPDGYLWIGTAGGLVRFDGVRFTIFDRTNTPVFRDDSILVLRPSRDGSLWIGAEGGGLLRYRDGMFTGFGPKEGLTNGFVRAVYEDRDGVLWIGTDRGLFRKRGDAIERLDGTAAQPVLSVTSIAGDAAGDIWIASNSGLLKVSGRITHHMGSMGVRAVRAAVDGGVWAAAPSGISHISGNGITRVSGMDNLTFTTLAPDAAGNLWIGTLAAGVIRLVNGRIVQRDPDILPARAVFSIFVDREENVWVGTGDGLVRMSRIAVDVLDSRDGLSDDNISNIYEGADGAPWLITIDGRLFRYVGGRIVPFALAPGARAWRYNSVFEDRNGGLWLGSWQGIRHIAGGRVLTYTTAQGLRNNQVRQYLEDRRGNLWIGLGSGLSRWDGSHFQNYYLEDGLSYGSVRILKEDRNGDLLVGTDAGLNRIRDTRFIADPAFSALQSERVWSIHQDPAGSLWIGTRGGGLFRIKHGKTSRITARDGLLSNAIYQILDDGRGNLWMSGPAGVFFAPQKELDRVADGGAGPVPIVPYGAAEGLESTQMNGGIGPAGFRSRSGDLWFPSVKGAVRINPAEIRIARPPTAVIEAIEADERPLPLTGALIAPPGRGKLEIRYTAPNLRSPERITFRYRLEPFDLNWNTATRGRAAYYTNLPPGRYNFRIVAIDSAAAIQSSEANLSFTWAAHFYQTRWFYAASIAVTALAVWGTFWLYAQQTKKRYAVLFAERTRIAREMHDTVIQGCAGISTLLEAVCSLPPAATDSERELIQHARVQARLTLDEARQVIWDLRHTALETGLAGVLGDFACNLSKEKGISIETEFSGDAPPVEERTMRSILLVAREAIRNAANHGEPNQIRIRVLFNADEVHLEVHDDGCGFTPSRDFGEHGHYGIIGMRERVEQLGGEFEIRSSLGRGTTVMARLPLSGPRSRRERVDAAI